MLGWVLTRRQIDFLLQPNATNSDGCPARLPCYLPDFGVCVKAEEGRKCPQQVNHLGFQEVKTPEVNTLIQFYVFHILGFRNGRKYSLLQKLNGMMLYYTSGRAPQAVLIVTDLPVSVLRASDLLRTSTQIHTDLQMILPNFLFVTRKRSAPGVMSTVTVSAVGTIRRVRTILKWMFLIKLANNHNKKVKRKHYKLCFISINTPRTAGLPGGRDRTLAAKS